MHACTTAGMCACASMHNSSVQFHSLASEHMPTACLPACLPCLPARPPLHRLKHTHSPSLAPHDMSPLCPRLQAPTDTASLHATQT
eukprot:364752-Chlamydomonas_euryale.AAC.8